MANKTRVLYIITKSVWAGAGKYVYDLATALPQAGLPAGEAGFSPMVAAGPEPSPSASYGVNGQNTLFQKIKMANIPYFEIKSFQRDINIFKEFFAFFEIFSLLIKTKPDIIHVSSAKAGGVAGVAFFFYSSLKKLPMLFRRISRYVRPKETALAVSDLRAVFTVHGWTFNEPRPKWQIFLIKFFSKLTCVFYDKIICVSEYDYQSALQNKIAPARKLITIRNGIKPEDYSFFSKEEARKKLSELQSQSVKIPHMPDFDTKLIIGTIGEFTKNKGHEHLIEAIKSVISSQYPVVSILIGFDGGEKQNLESRIKNYKLDDKVFLIDNLPNAANHLKAFDIFVLPSLKEGLPYVLLEAGLAEIPIIATNVGGVPEIIHPALSRSDLKNLKRSDLKETGVLVIPANPDEIANAIKKLIENPELAKALAANARQKILSEFSFEKMLQQTLAAYKN